MVETPPLRIIIIIIPSIILSSSIPSSSIPSSMVEQQRTRINSKLLETNVHHHREDKRSQLVLKKQEQEEESFTFANSLILGFETTQLTACLTWME